MSSVDYGTLAGIETAPARPSLYDTLRDAILDGRLPPGVRLKAAALAKEHVSSLTVVREALSRLAGERLVDFEPQMGFAVRRLSVEDLRDLVDQRILFESIALRRCLETSRVDWQAEVLAAHHRLANTPMVDDDGRLSGRWTMLHDGFHSAVLMACGSPRLFRTIRAMAQEAEIYARALLPVVNRDDEMREEHAALLEAILGRDADRAVDLLTRHLVSTRDTMLPLLMPQPAFA